MGERVDVAAIRARAAVVVTSGVRDPLPEDQPATASLYSCVASSEVLALCDEVERLRGALAEAMSAEARRLAQVRATER